MVLRSDCINIPWFDEDWGIKLRKHFYMIIKKAVYKKVRVTQAREVSPEKYGCDCCRKEIKEYPNEVNRLELSVWETKEGDSNSKNYHFCSWKCLLKFLPSVKSNYFASLPFLHFDEKSDTRTAKEFMKLISKLVI